jgi:hypothetical protein
MTTLRALTTVLFTVTAMAVTPKPSAVALVSLAGGAPLTSHHFASTSRT